MKVVIAGQSLLLFQSNAYYVRCLQDNLFCDFLDLDKADMITDTNLYATYYSNKDVNGDEIESDILYRPFCNYKNKASFSLLLFFPRDF
jgi:hypothetical protein